MPALFCNWSTLIPLSLTAMPPPACPEIYHKACINNCRFVFLEPI